jgi:hypothetical protein
MLGFAIGFDFGASRNNLGTLILSIPDKRVWDSLDAGVRAHLT